MFAICARIVPNMGLRVMRSALTRTSPPSTATDVPVRTTCCSAAFAPFTRTSPSCTVTVTPAGIGTGFLPTRDMPPSLPDLREELAAEAGLPRFAIGHETPRGGHHRHTQAAHDARDARLRHVHAAAGRRDAPDTGDHAGVRARVLEVDAERALTRVVDDLEVVDEALAQQNLRDLL